METTALPTPTYRAHTWAGLPAYTCLACGQSTVSSEYSVALAQMTTHLHEIHAAAPVEEPALLPMLDTSDPPTTPETPTTPATPATPDPAAAPDAPATTE
jgi:hypothetical protein